MTRIKELSLELANMIAAGEVVERPSSVVKELVENSIDAKASVIKVDLIDSGLRKITVTDNGFGMEPSEIPLALKRHATSKISSVEDLFRIVSLGFRGEALPSIASVSQMTITSKTKKTDGYYYRYRAGIKTEEGLTAFPEGTKVEVENLFFNTPARYKHLGNSYAELANILDYLYKSALSHPEIAFLCTNNGKTLFQTTGNSDIIEIIASSFGPDSAKAMLSFKGQNNLYRIWGLSSSPGVFRSNRNGINIVLNKRVIRNLSISYAITDAYQTLLPIGKYPITVLYIEADPSLVDVNVHPAKLEVRFTDERELKTLITAVLKETLFQARLPKFNSEESPVEKPLDKSTEPIMKTAPLENTEANTEDEPLNLWDQFFGVSEEKEAKEDFSDNFHETSPASKDKEVYEMPEPKPLTVQENYEQLSFDQDTKEKRFFQNLRYIGQYHQTYLLLEDEENLYLIDQHAAMERLMYEKISKSFESPKAECYELLIPLRLEVSVSEMPLIMNLTDEFAKLGITIEPFGPTALVVRTVPTWIPESLESEFLHDMINHLLHEKTTGKARLYDSLAKKLSCKQSIKAHMKIRPDEVGQLLKDLDQAKMPLTCPHGRPTIISFKRYEIEKLFQRVMG